MPINWKKFGKDINRKRADQGMSIRDLAKQLKMTPATLSRADRGLHVSAENFLDLASYFLDTDPRLYHK